MNALTVRQPWANYIADNLKPIETRSWYTKYRGPLLIHSSKKPVIYPAGVALAIVTLLDVRRMEREDEKEAKVPYNKRLFSFVLGKIWKIPRPFKMSGALYIYNTEEIEDAPHHQIRLVEHAYLAGCPNCKEARFVNLGGKKPVCAKQEGCARWYDAKKKPYRLVKVDLLKE
jgi:hypothetical protein